MIVLLKNKFVGKKSLVPEKSIYDYVKSYYDIDCFEIISLLQTCKRSKHKTLPKSKLWCFDKNKM